MSLHAHCPLCIQPFLHNAMYIFLDIDGVLIDRLARSTSEKIDFTVRQLFKEKFESNQKFTELEWRIAASEHFYSSPLENLYLLIDEIQKKKPVQIVISSQWRNDGTLKQIRDQMLAKHRFSELIVGKTPPEDDETWAPEIKDGCTFESIAKKKYNLTLCDRAEQIEFWRRDHNVEESNILILDDCDSGLSQRFPSCFVQVSSFLSRKEVDIALKILKISGKKDYENLLSIQKPDFADGVSSNHSKKKDVTDIAIRILKNPAKDESQHSRAIFSVFRESSNHPKNARVSKLVGKILKMFVKD